MMLNIAANLLRKGYLPVVANKVYRRFKGLVRPDEATASRRWCEEVESSVDEFAASIDSALWADSNAFAKEFQESSARKLAVLGLDLGGGGHVALLHFLTRHLRPSAVLETGVAAGFSSGAVLSALESNGAGTLFSSDFPYFRLKNPERYVGFVVDDHLRTNWHLLIDGDRRNLPEILSQVDEVDMFHYDSDKSRDGRQFAMRLVFPKVKDGGIVVMDDIQDDMFFRDFVTENDLRFHVFEFEGKYLGLVSKNKA